MSNFSYDDFAVLVRSVTQDMLSSDSLRIVPLSDAPSMADAIRGTILAGLDSESNLPKQKNGNVVLSNVTVQHDSAGYCRLVGHIVKPQGGQAGQEAPVTTAKAFVLYRTVTADTTTKKEVIAVASLKEGFAIGDVCYPSFTITTVNNYQSVAFNPNAFATVEDLKNINGLDGLHIAFDHASGDIKLLDGKGNVLDQANLHMDADTIITDGEEGYKYVKTDVQQDIHAEKAFMPAGKTAGDDVKEKPYAVQNACFLVDVTKEQAAVDTAQATFNAAQKDVDTAQTTFNAAQNNFITNPNNTEFQTTLETAQNTLSTAQSNLAQAQNTLSKAQADLASLLSSKDVREGTSPAICGIRARGASDSTHKNYIIGGTYSNPTIGATGKPFLINESPNGTLAEVYSPDAFVWTVGNVAGLVKEGDGDAGESGEHVGKVRVVEGDTTTYRELTFAESMNVNAQALGFHVGDDIPLGTNIATLIGDSAGNMMDHGGFDAEKYMHEGTDSDYIDELVDAQRNLAKEELVAWNAQHPKLDHDGLHGTRISSDGVDIRNGKIEIGNGIPSEDGDSVKRYVIETDIDDHSAGARAGKGLQIGVMGSVKGFNGSEPIQKDILTINAEDYISGAPTCLALLKCSKSGDQATVSAGLEGGRITANFTASGAEADGVFTLTITDNRANNGFGHAPRIVEIIPVYKSGADAQEAVPAQRSISAITEPDKKTGGKTLSIQCSQVIDWAQSIDLGGTVATGGQDTTGNGMELYLIVKVY